MITFVFCRELEELEAIKEAEEAALAEAEAAAAEAAEAMEGLFGDMDEPDDGDDPGGGDGSPDSPSGDMSQIGNQVPVDSGPLVDVVSGSGISPNHHVGSIVSVSAGQKYVIQEDQGHGSFSQSIDGMHTNADDGRGGGEDLERVSLNSMGPTVQN